MDVPAAVYSGVEIFLVNELPKLMLNTLSVQPSPSVYSQSGNDAAYEPVYCVKD